MESSPSGEQIAPLNNINGALKWGSMMEN